MPNPDGSPTPLEQWLASQQSGNAANPDFTGSDGVRYSWDDKAGQYMPVKGGPARKTASEFLIPAGTTVRDPFSGRPMNSPAVSVPASDPRVGAMLFGMDPATYANINAMRDAGMLTDAQYRAALIGGADPSAGGGGGGGSADSVGWANLAQRQAEQQYQMQQDAIALERQRQQDALKASIDYLNQLANEQQLADQRRQAAQTATLDALPYAMAPGMTYAPGFTPDSAAVRYGLVDAFKPSPVNFNPNAIVSGNPYDQQVQQQIARYAAMSGQG